ncbi:MAG: hypothetical protein JSS76_20045 [Bacteroidetes bacterium]|nr:hypothetical protein [Bacteroidota bacterium]
MKKNLLLLVSVLILCALLLEVSLRIKGGCDTFGERTGISGYRSVYAIDGPTQRQWYFVHHQPVYWKGKEFTHAWTPNNEGFNDRNFAVSKSKRRIMVVGDSFVQSMGADQDSTLPKQIERIINRDQPDIPTEVWNCGSAGSDPVYEYRLYHDLLLKYQPDMAVVVINGSDVNDVVVRGGFERFLPDSTVRYHAGPWFEPLYARSYIVRSFARNVLGYNWQLIPGAELPARTERANAILTATLDSFVALCKEKNIHLLFCFHPMRAEALGYGSYQMRPLLAHCYAQHLPYVDMVSDMTHKGYSDPQIEELFWPIDGHCKNKGYLYLAELISKAIEAQTDTAGRAATADQRVAIR